MILSAPRDIEIESAKWLEVAGYRMVDLSVPFLIYAWRSVLWELSNWQNLLLGMFQFVGYLSKLLLALAYSFIGDPITYTILYIETAVHAIPGIIGYAAVRALPVATVMASVGEPWVRVLAIISFTALAIHHHSSKLAEETEVASSGRKVPLPLLGIGISHWNFVSLLGGLVIAI
ncbi:ATP-binding cassette sub-family A member 8 [Bienertia sinuspersici]